MKRAELREAQRPLKERYREEPDTAQLTLRADGELGSEGVACSVDTGRALVEAGLHPASGGDGALACSGDMLLQALVACAGVTLRSVAVNRDLEVTGRVVAEGDLDFRGTLGVDREAPVGFTAIRLRFELELGRDRRRARRAARDHRALLRRLPDARRRRAARGQPRQSRNVSLPHSQHSRRSRAPDGGSARLARAMSGSNIRSSKSSASSRLRAIIMISELR